ncbi:MAG: 1,4-alpha-glucan branching protein GlgB, partial [Lachnospiraceae bacterium]|nr:1,4-alpha-glucan branching protein GlgB [Lachnospiraceae bacterium]
MMDWAAIEEVVYAECDHPQEYLGAHTVGKQTLVQAFFPDAKAVSLYINGSEGPKGKTVKEEIKMERMDDTGFFAALLPGKNRKDYKYYVQYKEKGKRAKQFADPYNYVNNLSEDDAETFHLGSLKNSYEVMGAHMTTVDGVRGCMFRVWAPNAVRVSVVGDFNEWNEKIHQMVRLYNTGIFEIFLPDVKEGEKYKYAVLMRGGIASFRIDPYSVLQELRPDCASIITSLKGFKWQDEAWLKERKAKNIHELPMNIYECKLGAFLNDIEVQNSDQGEIVPDMKMIAAAMISYVKEMGYTHVALMPIMEYAQDETEGYQTSLYYAPTSRYGTPWDYQYLINELHKEQIGVILQWTPNCFAVSEDGFGRYDGTCLYEHEDPRRGVDPRNGTLLFNYQRPEVASYLLDNAVYWIREYHVDGFMVCDTASMLYLDYYRQPGQWIANIYGGNENLEAIEFIKKWNRLLHKKYPEVLTIAEDESGWSGMTGAVQDDCLGFDLCCNHGWNQDVLGYMAFDPIERYAHHHELTMSMIYQYNESYILPISHNNTNFGQGDIIDRMPGDRTDRINNMKVMYGYLMTHPGKKQMFMGQDRLQGDGAEDFREYIKALNHFYLEHKACYELDEKEAGFTWINNISANENVVVFGRNGRKAQDQLLIVLNFANRPYEKYKIGVPGMGRYREIFASDAKAYGGTGMINSRVIPSKDDECDGRDQSIRVTLAPLSISIFECSPYTEKELAEMQKKKEEKEQKRLENERKKAKLAKEKAKIRASLKEELAKKIADAEAAIEKELSQGSKGRKK